MSVMTVDQILNAVEELSPQDKAALMDRLRAMRRDEPRSILDEIPVIDVGEWPEGLSLRREELYGDDQR